LILQAIAGHDSSDPLSSNEPVGNYSASIGKGVSGLKAGILRGYFDEFIAAEVKESFAGAVETLKSLGIWFEDATIPHMDLIPAIKVATSRVENAAAHEPYLRTQSKDYNRQTLFSYVSALLTPAATYVQAQRARRIVCDEFNALLRRCDLLVLPTIPFTVPTIEDCREGYVEIDGNKIKRQDERGGLESLCCIPFIVTGLPAISVCCGFSKAGTPIGLQIAAGAFREDLLLQVAAAYERATSWSEAKPKLAL
jgi:aspartyl-tRNA(Asn)/glutamyl-tRNA(Gln) amidotransferase subunit A